MPRESRAGAPGPGNAAPSPAPAAALILILIPGLAATAAVLVGPAAAARAAPIQKVRAPDFSFQGPGGAEIRLSDLRGSAVLLIFYSAGCPHCRAELSVLPQRWGSCEAAGESKVVMIGVSGDEKFDRSLYEERAGEGWYFVEGPDVAANYGVRAVPTMVVVSPDGYVWATFLGETDPGEICSAVSEALNQSQAQGGGQQPSVPPGGSGGPGGVPAWALAAAGAAAAVGAALALLRRGRGAGR